MQELLALLALALISFLMDYLNKKKQRDDKKPKPILQELFPDREEMGEVAIDIHPELTTDFVEAIPELIPPQRVEESIEELILKRKEEKKASTDEEESAYNSDLLDIYKSDETEETTEMINLEQAIIWKEILDLPRSLRPYDWN